MKNPAEPVLFRTKVAEVAAASYPPATLIKPPVKGVVSSSFSAVPCSHVAICAPFCDRAALAAASASARLRNVEATPIPRASSAAALSPTCRASRCPPAASCAASPPPCTIGLKAPSGAIVGAGTVVDHALDQLTPVVKVDGIVVPVHGSIGAGRTRSPDAIVAVARLVVEVIGNPDPRPRIEPRRSGWPDRHVVREEHGDCRRRRAER